MLLWLKSYDRFGKILHAQRMEDYTIGFTSPLTHGKFTGGCVRLLAGFETVLASSRWDHEQDALVLSYQGVPSCVEDCGSHCAVLGAGFD